MGNNESSKSNKCRSEHQTCATVCALTNSAPELGSPGIIDVIDTSNCIRTTCQDRYDICKVNAKEGNNPDNPDNPDSKRVNDDKIAKVHSGNYTAPNGDRYNSGKLTAFVSNGLRYRVTRVGRK